MTKANTSATPPAIGEVWKGQGGVYMGLCRGRGGLADYHLILAVVAPKKRLTWDAAGTWAKKVKADGYADFSLPDRRESRVLWANDAGEFEADWYWTGEQYSAQLAWSQFFYYGYQDYLGESYEGLARAVRRLPVNSSVLSTVAA